MVKALARLKNPDGTQRQDISVGEGDRLVAQGQAIRTSKPKDPRPIYRLRAWPTPSNSKETPAMLTIADLEAVAGVRRTNARRRERLVGWGLIADRTIDLPFASGARAAHYEDTPIDVLVSESILGEKELIRDAELPIGSSFTMATA